MPGRRATVLTSRQDVLTPSTAARGSFGEVVWVVGQRAARAESGNRVQCRSGCVTKGAPLGQAASSHAAASCMHPICTKKTSSCSGCRRGRGPDPCWTGRAAGMPERPGRRYKGRVAKATTTGAPTCFCGDSRAPKYGLQHMCQIARQRVAAGGSSAAQESCARGAVAAALTSSCDTAPACCITTMAGGSSDQRNSLVATQRRVGVASFQRSHQQCHAFSVLRCSSRSRQLPQIHSKAVCNAGQVGPQRLLSMQGKKGGRARARHQPCSPPCSCRTLL